MAKNRIFTVQAVNTVVSCFEGQTLKINKFTLERSRDMIKKNYKK